MADPFRDRERELTVPRYQQERRHHVMVPLVVIEDTVVLPEAPENPNAEGGEWGQL